MTRDELILTALGRGEASTAELVELTDIPERSCRRGLRQLAGESLVWSPERGTWRLTQRGRELAEELAGATDARRESLGAAVQPGTTQIPPEVVASGRERRRPATAPAPRSVPAGGQSTLRILLNEGIEGLVRRYRSGS